MENQREAMSRKTSEMPKQETVPSPDLGPAAEIHTSLMSVWREGLINTVTLGLLNGEQIVATLTNKISSMLLESCQRLQMEQ